MALQETNVVATELERVASKVPTLFEREDTFYSTIEKKNVEVVSAIDMRVGLELRPGGTFGHFDPDSSSASMGRGGWSGFDKATIPCKHLKYGVEWTKKAEWATDDGRKANLNVLRHALAKSMAEFRRNVDSLCMTTDGILGTVASVSNSSNIDTCVMDSSFGARLLRFGQPIGIVSSDLGTSRTTGTDKTLTFVDYPTKTIKYSSPSSATAQATDKVIVGNLGNVTGTSIVSIKGVTYHHDSAATGTWFGLDRAANPEIRATRVNANSSALALPFARRAINGIGDRLGQDAMGGVNAWMHPCQKQAYEELGQLVSVIQKQASESGLNLYYGDDMQLAGAPVKPHFSWHRSRIDFVNPKLWGRAEMHPAGFYEVDGRKIFEIRGSDGGIVPSQIFYITVSMQLFHMNPAGAAYIDGLTVPTGY